MPLSIKRKDSSILLVHESQNYSVVQFSFWLLLASALLCVLAGIFLTLIGFLITILLIGLSVFIWQKRELWCMINRATGEISYKKGGVLSSKYDSWRMRYSITEVIAIVMKRHRSRGFDTFQICLFLVGDLTLPLSSAALSFAECQSFANEIHQFIGVDKPLTAVD
jgi:hypothetical protein